MLRISVLAQNVGIAEDALRLLIGMILAYPVFILYTISGLRRCSTLIQHLYFISTGMLISYWTLGIECLAHNLICIIGNYIILKVLNRSFYSAVCAFIFQLGYLSVGLYFENATTDYKVTWTMPHCILCLRLIGTAIDVYDGTKHVDFLDQDQKLNALKDVPSILEMTSHIFYLPSYFIGPQHSMRRFRKFIQRNIDDGDMTGSTMFAFKRFLLAMLYFLIHFFLSGISPESYITSADFAQLSYLEMSLYLSIWVKGHVARLIGVWLLTEGSVVLSGLGYNGKSEDGDIAWNGGANVRVWLYETCTNYHQMIQSVNINTNAWVKTYVFKRCKFLKNQMLSQLITVLFLAIWHGSHSGYYLTFLYQILIVRCEKQFFCMVDNSPRMNKLYQSSVFVKVSKALGYCYFLFFLPHCVIPFVLLSYNVYAPLVLTTRCVILIVFGSWPLWKFLVKMMLNPRKNEHAATDKSKPKGGKKSHVS